MVEITECTIFILILLICVVIDIIRAVKTRKREWMLLFLFHALYLFSSVYYELYIIFFDDEPQVSHICEIGWYVSYLFLTLLLQNIRDKEMDNKKYKVLFIIPVFTFSMAIGFIIYSEGDVFSNAICALLLYLRNLLILLSLIRLSSTRWLRFPEPNVIFTAVSGAYGRVHHPAHNKTITVCSDALVNRILYLASDACNRRSA